MIKKLRWKVIALTMVMLAVVVCAVCIGAYSAAERSVEVSGTQELSNALRGAGTSRPVLLLDVLPSGTVRVEGHAAFDEEMLLRVVNECLAREASSGVLDEYNVRYVRQDGLFLRIALAECAWETQALRALSVTLLLVGLGALIVLGICVYFLSGLITKPVARAWQQQRQFISDAGHELKTPLAVILSSAELLRDTVPDEKGYIDNIRAEGGRMRHLVESLLTLSRTESLPPRSMETVDLSALAEKLVLSFEPLAYEAGREMQSQIAPHVAVKGSAEQLHRAAAVLLDNALKYGAAQTPVILALKAEGKTAMLTVENFGPPIPAEDQRHMFDRFYRSDISRHSEGFGLGLPIARQIAQAHRGDIACRSDERSTRFTLTVPKK